MGNGNGTNITRSEAFQALGKVLQGVLMVVMSIIAYQGKQVLEEVRRNDRRLTTIEASRYTPGDALQDRRDWQRANEETRTGFRAEISTLRAEILASQAKIEAKIDRLIEAK